MTHPTARKWGWEPGLQCVRDPVKTAKHNGSVLSCQLGLRVVLHGLFIFKMVDVSCL